MVLNKTEGELDTEKKIDTTVNSHNLECITKRIEDIIGNDELLKHQDELHQLEIDYILLQQNLYKFQEIDEEFIKYSNGLYDLYSRAKTEWWAHRLDVKIDSFKDTKFSLRISFKDKIEFKIHLKSKGK